MEGLYVLGQCVERNMCEVVRVMMSEMANHK